MSTRLFPLRNAGAGLRQEERDTGRGLSEVGHARVPIQTLMCGATPSPHVRDTHLQRQKGLSVRVEWLAATDTLSSRRRRSRAADIGAAPKGGE